MDLISNTGFSLMQHMHGIQYRKKDRRRKKEQKAKKKELLCEQSYKCHLQTELLLTFCHQEG